MSLRWACAVTTVQSRRQDLLPRTLNSLRRAGWNDIRLFVDGADGATIASYEKEFCLPVTGRSPGIRTVANWWLALWEVYARAPYLDRAIIAQDDLLACKGLRAYLEATTCPGMAPGTSKGDVKGFLWNLYCFPQNTRLCPQEGSGARLREGWFLSNQMGRGAVALVFDRAGVQTLLSHPHMVEKFLDTDRGHRSVDGAIITALKDRGYKELVHHPSLVQHMGDVSTMGSRRHPQAETFRGEDWDAMSLLKHSGL